MSDQLSARFFPPPPRSPAMSDLWINWRFGRRHLQIGPRGVSFTTNDYWTNNKPRRWFELY
jgi:hypothetical protein